ncbi:pyridoxal phosphate-dependent aminotransferase [Pseudochelatococcus sp. B33]
MSPSPILPLPHLLLVPPYAAAEKPQDDGTPKVILSQNELPTAPSPKAVEAAATALLEANRYPDSDCTELGDVIAAHHGLQAERILCSPGSMELLGILTRSYAGPGGEVIITEHGYGYFRTVIQLAGATAVIAPETSLRADVDAILACVTDKTRMVLLANPNNPTGTCLPWAEICRLHANLPQNVLLALDAAYAEFVDDPSFQAGSQLVDGSVNTVMIRTFSKIYGLAGMRVGWGYFPADVANLLRRVIPPSSVSMPAQAAAIAALSDKDHLRKTREAVVSQRQRLTLALQELGLHPVPSETNFILAELPSARRAKEAYEFLKSRQIFLRPVLSAGLPQHLRITIGSPGEVSLLIAGLAEFLSRQTEDPASQDAAKLGAAHRHCAEDKIAQNMC